LKEKKLDELQINCNNYDDIYINHAVYSRDLIFEPFDNDATIYNDSNRPKPVHEDILITRLRPGQEIELECYCELGRGHVHAKWSPVSTAWYKLQPVIRIKDDIPKELQYEIYKCCPKNVFTFKKGDKTKNINDIEDIGNYKLYANKLRDCT